MDDFISQNDLTALYRKEAKKSKGITTKGKLPERGQRGIDKGIFLSHSHLDKTIIERIRVFFNKLNIDLYVDWVDDHMPKVTDRKTAEVIKQKIAGNHKFIFLATTNALRSKWCNWEIGIADSIKGIRNIAVLPIVPESRNWKGNEYIKLYPQMKIDIVNLEFVSAKDISISDTVNAQSIPFFEWMHS